MDAALLYACEPDPKVGHDNRQHSFERKQNEVVVPIGVTGIVTGMRVNLAENTESMLASYPRRLANGFT
jgi:hypothetical protein